MYFRSVRSLAILILFLAADAATSPVVAAETTAAKAEVGKASPADSQSQDPPDTLAILERQTVPVKRVVTEVNALESEVDAVKHLQAKTTDELGALLPALALSFKEDP